MLTAAVKLTTYNFPFLSFCFSFRCIFLLASLLGSGCLDIRAAGSEMRLQQPVGGGAAPVILVTRKSRTTRSSSGFLFNADEDLAAASKQREWEACLSGRAVQINHAHI